VKVLPSTAATYKHLRKFNNRFWKDLMSKLGIKLQTNTICPPDISPAAVNPSLVQYLRRSITHIPENSFTEPA
jgi:hypothetical protein